MGLAAREIRGYLSHASADNLNNLASTGGSSGIIKVAPVVASNTWVQSGPTVVGVANNNNNHHKGRKAHNKATSTACDSESDAEFLEPIYASLSDEMGTMSSLGDAASRCCSVTTAANNDFIFHKGPAQSKNTAAADTSEDDVRVKKMQLEPRKHRVRPRYYQSSQLKVLDSSSEDDVKIKPLSDEENNTSRKGMYNSNKKRYKYFIEV